MKTYIRIITLAIAAIASMAISGCRHSDDPEPPKPAIHRSVLVYMLASNNLGSNSLDYDGLDLQEMLDGVKNGALGGGRLLVYHADYSGDPELKEVTANGINVLKTYTDGNLSVSSARMTEVINDFKAQAPADDYGIILWGHATGWLQDGIDDPIDRSRSSGDFGLSYSYGYDHSTKNWMNTSTLARTLEGKGFSFVYFDCCLMASIEALYEMQNVAPRMVASSTEVPGYGMPYDLTLPHLFARGEADLEAASRAYFKYYEDNPRQADGCPVTTAVITTAGINALARATREVYEQAQTSCPLGYTGQLLYVNSNYYDFDHYIMTLAGADSPLYARWRSALDDVVGYKAASDYIWDIRPIEHFCGLSTFIIKSPNDITKNNYNTLKWYGDIASALPL